MALTYLPMASVQICQFWCAASRPSVAVLSLVACVPRGLPQGEHDDKRKQALNRRRQPLDHAQVTAAVSSCDQEPARQPGEDHGHRRAAADTEDPRLRRRGAQRQVRARPLS